MADRIRGITIEIDGNTTKLSKALEGVNKSIKNTQQQLKDVDKLLKLDPGNIDLLRQREELLNSAVSDTKDKLNTLKDALAQMDAAGVDKASSEYMALQREIVSTEGELKNLESAAAKSNATLAKIGATADKVASGANKVANATKGLSAAAAGAVAGLAGMAVNAAKSADDLNTMSKQTGLSTESLQKMQYAADRIDVSVEDIAGAAEKMKGKIKSSEKSFEALGVSVRDANGNYRETEEIFQDVVKAIGGIENETERDIAAMDIFGKSASNLAGLLDDGGEALRTLGQEAIDKGLIIPQEDLDKANELNDTLDELRATLSGSFGKAAVSALQAMAPLLASVAGWIEKLAIFLSGLSPTTLRIVAIIGGLIAVISPIAGTISSIATAISVITPIIAAVNAVIAANPIVLTIAGIVAAVAALVAIGVILYKNWDKIKEKAAELWENLTGKFAEIKEAVVGKFTEIKDNVTATFDNVKTKVSDAFGKVKETASNALNSVKETTRDKLNNIKSAFEENGGGLKGTVAAAWQGIKEYFTLGFDVVNGLTGGKLGEIKDAFFNKFNEIKDNALTWGKDIIDNLVAGIKAKIEAVKEAVGNIAQTIKEFLGFSEPEKGPLSNFHTFMPDMIDLMTKGIRQNIGKVESAMDVLANKLVPDTQVNVNYNNAALEGYFDSVNKSIANSSQNNNVTVVLEGDAQGLFRAVQQQNRLNTLATGKNALIY